MSATAGHRAEPVYQGATGILHDKATDIQAPKRADGAEPLQKTGEHDDADLASDKRGR